MKSMINTTHIEGYLYEHDLEVKTSGPNSKNPGTEFISGTVSIATDDACINIVPVHYTYVTAMTSKNAPNNTYTILNNIINGTYKSIMKDGKENATKFRIDSAIGLNEFYSDRNGEEQLVSQKRNEGGFIHTCDVLAEDESTRNTFKTDMLITGCRRVEADEERDIPEKLIIKGAIFDFRKSLLPVEYTVLSPDGMTYFESLVEDANGVPVFTNVWGRQISETIVRKIVEKSAFGQDSVREVRNNRRDFVITGSAVEPYLFDDESTITANELTEAISNREVYLAELKQNREKYKATQNNPAATTIKTPAAGSFKF